jgi:hypothetical protein
MKGTDIPAVPATYQFREITSSEIADWNLDSPMGNFKGDCLLVADRYVSGDPPAIYRFYNEALAKHGWTLRTETVGTRCADSYGGCDAVYAQWTKDPTQLVELFFFEHSPQILNFDIYECPFAKSAENCP